ncbi:MAG: chloride channel protein [Anaeromyxobacteraceae bacterium]
MTAVSPGGGDRGLGRLAAAAVAAGALTGVVGALFRTALTAAEGGRGVFLAWVHRWPAAGWVLPVLAAAAAAGLSRALVRLAPEAAGGGLPHVEAVVRGEVPPPSRRLVPVKFAGGLLSIGSGMALSGEGLTEQMGAALGEETSRALRLPPSDRILVLASCAGAGLGVAFDAPLAGALFALEQVARRIGVRTLVASLLTSAAAVGALRFLLGDFREFPLGPVPAPSVLSVVPFAVLGGLLGLLGAAYGASIVGAVERMDRLSRVPVEVRAALVGAVVGLVAWVDPGLVGDGHVINQRILAGGMTLAGVAVLAGVRWVLGPLCFSTRLPGGLIMPTLVVGAALGTLAHAVAGPLLGGALPSAPAVAAVGMAAFFAAVIRAPFTGILLVAEATATSTLLLPMLAACGTAVAVATALRSPPVYDALRARLVATSSPPRSPPPPSPRPPTA